MRRPTGQVNRPTGEVTRVARELHVRLPLSVVDAERLRLHHVLSIIDGVREVDPNTLAVPDVRAPQLAAQLSVWPATTVEWTWQTDALLLRDDIAASATALGRVVATAEDDQGRAVDDLELGLERLGFSRELRSFQRRDVARLLFMRNGANFGVPGSGKTTVAYATFTLLGALRDIDLMLVMAPPSAFEAWETEARDCYRPGMGPRIGVGLKQAARDVSVLVLNYERLEQRRTIAELDAWISNRRVLVVFDEAHRAKAGRAGVRGAGALTLAQRATRRLVLTGTPMPNGADDLAAAFDLVWPGHGHRLAGGDLAALRQRAYVRVTKTELDLPAVRLRVERVALDGSHRRLYDALSGRASRLARDPRATVEALEHAVLRLIAAATSPATILAPDESFRVPVAPSDVPISELLANPGDHVRPAKIVRAAQLVAANAARGRKTLVWSNFLGNVRALRDACAVHNPAVIVGSTPADAPSARTDRARELARFRSEPTCRVLIATPQTLGEGVSLHRVCVDQIHVDRGFAAGTFLQSLDRTHRLGMDPDCAPTCTILVAEDTIDEHVHRVLSQKVADMSAALSDPALRAVAMPDTDSAVDLTTLLLAGTAPDELRALLGAVVHDGVYSSARTLR